MVLNSKHLNQKGNNGYDRNFSWANNALKSYRSQIEDDENILISFIEEKINIQEIREKFEKDKEDFLKDNYYGKEELSDFTKRFEKFLRVVECDIKSFYIFSKTVASSYFEVFLKDLIWNSSTSKLEIKNVLSGLMDKDTEIEVIEYVSYILNSFFVESIFSENEVYNNRISCICNIITDIHFLLFRTRIQNFKFSFSFDDLKFKIFEHQEFDGNAIYINDFIESNERDAFDIIIAKCLFFEQIKEGELLSFFSKQIKKKFDELLVDILKINCSKFKLEKVESGFIPLFMFTDSQILNCIKEGENTYSFSTIKSIKKITSEEQFKRFMSLLSQI